MQLRRPALVASAMVLSIAPLAGCASDVDWASEREYTQAAGANDRDGDVDVLNALIVSAEPGKGTVYTALVNNLSDADAQLISITAVDGAATFVLEEPIEIPARGIAKVEDSGVTATGDFEAGQVVDVTFAFEGAEPVTIGVPVMPATHEFEGLDES